MQDKFLNGKNSQTDNSESLLWCSTSFDWPYEIVVSEAQITAMQLPNLFDWVVVRIMRDFADEPPTLCQAASELGINGAVFLKESLQRLINSGIVEQIEAGGIIDFANCHLTNKAIPQNSASLPERHGLKLCFDSITGEYFPQLPENLRENPEFPILPSEQLPPKRTDIGLQKAREYAREQDEPFLAAQSKMTDVKVDQEQGYFMWQPFEVSIRIARTGTIYCHLEEATSNQQQWINKLNFQNDFFKQLFANSLDKRFCNSPGPIRAFDKWVLSVSNLIDPKLVIAKVVLLIESARKQVLLNAYWLNFSEIKKALEAALERGIHCVVFGQKHQLANIDGGLADNIEKLELDDSPDCLCNISAITDGSKAISIDNVELRTPTKQHADVIIASFMEGSCALELQHQLLGQLASFKV